MTTQPKSGHATAAIGDAAGPGRGSLAGLIAAMAQIGGLGLGPLVGGLLLETIDDPLRLIYVIYLIALAVAALAIAVVPETVRRVRDRRSRVITPLRPRVVLAQANAIGLVGFAGFAVLGLFTAVTPAFLDRLGQHAPISTGLVVFSVFAASALGQLSTMRIRPRTTLMAGVATLSIGAAVVGAGLHLPSIPILVAGGLVAGFGQGMSFHAALSQATAQSPPTERGAAASSFFVICYLGISLPVIGLGAATQAWGLLVAGQVFAGAVVAIGVTTLAWLPRPGTRPNRPDPDAHVGSRTGAQRCRWECRDNLQHGRMGHLRVVLRNTVNLSMAGFIFYTNFRLTRNKQPSKPFPKAKPALRPLYNGYNGSLGFDEFLLQLQETGAVPSCTGSTRHSASCRSFPWQPSALPTGEMTAFAEKTFEARTPA